MDTISLGLHVFFASILVGPQVLLFLAVVPATWLIEDEGLRRSVTRVVTRRFGVLSGISLVGLLATGLYQFYSDGIVPVAMGRYLARTIPNCRAEFIPGGGHYLVFDRIGPFLEAMVERA